MITDIQKKFIEGLISGEITKIDNPKRYSMMMQRIRKQIDKNIARGKWLADNCIKILEDFEEEITDETLERHRRFKCLIYIASKLDPMTQIEGVELKDALKKLAQLYPEIYFEITKKKYRRGL